MLRLRNCNLQAAQCQLSTDVGMNMLKARITVFSLHRHRYIGSHWLRWMEVGWKVAGLKAGGWVEGCGRLVGWRAGAGGWRPGRAGRRVGSLSDLLICFNMFLVLSLLEVGRTADEAGMVLATC